MGIEKITPDLVSINGIYVELRDTRQPDQFDVACDDWNRQLQDMYSEPIDDVHIDLTGSFLSNVDPEVIAYQQIPRLIDLAMQASVQLAISYRDFNVGASAYAVSEDGLSAAYLVGANNTPFKGAPKKCAEMNILGKARANGLDRIVAMSIFGPADHGTVNAVKTPTLHPCDQCRGMLEVDPAIQDDTLLVTSNPDGYIELMFANELIDMHKPKD